tara:strand:+ start:391 stop:648 length:258 start_codon:yes stop_codon:yes gene_type:complete
MMIKFLLLPLILVGCTAPITDPPAHALEVEEELLYRIIDYAEGYRVTEKNLDIDSMINNALMEFENGSNDTPKSEELLQLPSNED